MTDVSTSGSRREVHDAFEIIGGAAAAPVFLTCEHASERLPEGYAWHPGDERLRGTHWAYDLGAADIVSELARALGAPAVLCRTSRLLVDPNRPKDSDTLFRREAEGALIELNRDLTDAERSRRLELYYDPYHAAISRELARSSAEVVFSVHSFTPVYEGHARPMELGVLFDREEALAERAARVLRAVGFVTAMNEPYSGKDGLIHAAEHHAQAHGRRALELEVRQDLAVLPEFRARLVEALRRVFG